MSKKISEASTTSAIKGFVANKMGKVEKKKKIKSQKPWYLQNLKELKELVSSVLGSQKFTLSEVESKGSPKTSLSVSYSKLKQRYEDLKKDPTKNPEQYKKLHQFFSKMEKQFSDIDPEKHAEEYAKEKIKTYLNVPIGELPKEIQAQLQNELQQSSFSEKETSFSPKTTLAKLLRSFKGGTAKSINIGSKDKGSSISAGLSGGASRENPASQDREFILSSDLLKKIKSWHEQNKEKVSHEPHVEKGSEEKREYNVDPELKFSNIAKEPDDSKLKSKIHQYVSAQMEKNKKSPEAEKEGLPIQKGKVRPSGSKHVAPGLSRGEKFMKKEPAGSKSLSDIDRELQDDDDETQERLRTKGARPEEIPEEGIDKILDQEEVPEQDKPKAAQVLKNAYTKFAKYFLFDDDSPVAEEIIERIARDNNISTDDAEGIRNKMFPRGEYNKQFDKLKPSPKYQKLFDDFKKYYAAGTLIRNPQFIDALRDYLRRSYQSQGHEMLADPSDYASGATTDELKSIFKIMLGSKDLESAEKEMSAMRIADPVTFKSKFMGALTHLKSGNPEAYKKEREQMKAREAATKDNIWKSMEDDIISKHSTLKNIAQDTAERSNITGVAPDLDPETGKRLPSRIDPFDKLLSQARDVALGKNKEQILGITKDLDPYFSLEREKGWMGSAVSKLMKLAQTPEQKQKIQKLLNHYHASVKLKSRLAQQKKEPEAQQSLPQAANESKVYSIYDYLSDKPEKVGNGHWDKSKLATKQKRNKVTLVDVLFRGKK